MRQIQSILCVVDPEKDEFYAMRHIRDVGLVYFRILSTRYPSMTACEKCYLVRILVVEACKRRFMEIGENAFEIQRYHNNNNDNNNRCSFIIIKVCQEIELGENSNCTETKLFLPSDSLMPENIQKPYREVEAYEYTSEHLREVKRG